MTENTRYVSIAPTAEGIQTMRGLFAENAAQHEAKIAHAEGLIETLDKEDRPLTDTERRVCIEALELLIAQSTDSAHALREGVAEIDRATTNPETRHSADAGDGRDGEADTAPVNPLCAMCSQPIRAGQSYASFADGTANHMPCPSLRGTWDDDDQDPGDVLGLDDDQPEF